MTESQKNRDQGRKSGKTKLNFTIDFFILVLMLSMVGTGLIIRYILPPGSGGRGSGRGLALWGMDRHDWGELHFWLAVGLLVLLLLHVALHWSWICNFVRRNMATNKPTSKLSRKTALALGAGFFVLLNILVGGFLWISNSNTSATTARGRELGAGAQRIVEQEWSPPQEQRFSDSRGIATDLEHDCVTEDKSDRPRGKGKDRIGQGKGLRSGFSRNKRVSRNLRDEHKKAHSGLGGKANHSDSIAVRGYMTLHEIGKKSGVSVETIKTYLGLPKKVSAHERLGRLSRRYRFHIEDVRRAIAAHGRL